VARVSACSLACMLCCFISRPCGLKPRSTQRAALHRDQDRSRHGKSMQRFAVSAAYPAYPKPWQITRLPEAVTQTLQQRQNGQVYTMLHVKPRRSGRAYQGRCVLLLSCTSPNQHWTHVTQLFDCRAAKVRAAAAGALTLAQSPTAEGQSRLQSLLQQLG